MDLFNISIKGWNIELKINLITILTLLVFIIIFWYIRKKGIFHKFNHLELNETTIGIGNQKLKIKPNYDDMQIAYKLWVELATRKVGLPIDFKNDVIFEIYNSWYEFFKVTREMVKDVPVSKMRKNESTRVIVNTAIEILNKGLRPHLTEWQAKYKKWYDRKITIDENQDLSPQEVQAKFPQYEQLTRDMEEVNSKLIEYRRIMKKLAIDRDDI